MILILLFIGGCNGGPETECYDAFGSTATSSSDSCDDYISSDDAALYIALSASGGAVLGAFAVIIGLYLFTQNGTGGLSAIEKTETFAPMAGSI